MPVSNGNSKMGRIPNWSVVPVRDCPNCTECREKCYALKAWRQYPSTRNSWNANSREAHAGDLKSVREYLTRKKPRWFRVHVAGDFFSREYAQQWAEIARQFPQTRFLAFTKAFAQIEGVNWPENVAVVRSVFPGQSLRGNGPIAFAGEPGDYSGAMKRRAELAMTCPGKCDKKSCR